LEEGLKNKGGSKNPQCPLGQEAKKDPAGFTSISGKLDKVESMQCEAVILKEAERMVQKR
jgi:hypothetical protein